MTKSTKVNVVVTSEFTYGLDGSRKRTLPKDWKGELPPSVAKKLKAEGKGHIAQAAVVPQAAAKAD